MKPFCASEAFACRDYAAEDLVVALRELKSGAVPAVRVPAYLAVRDAEAITKAFTESEAVRERRDGVGGRSLGAYHYGRTFDDYFAEVERTAQALDDVLAEGADPVTRLNDLVAQAMLAESGVNRVARWNGRDVADVRMSAWLPSADYLLDAHDDIGQLRDPRQVGFEPQQLPDEGVFAVNIYTSCPSDGGKLRLWNALPDGSVREELGIAYSGYPYPHDVLEPYEFIDVQPRVGDLVIICGALPHAVTLYEHPEPRIAVNYFFGPLGGSVVRWV